MRQRVTVRDVAAAAGVSPATASRVLANHPTVSPELARRVVDASARLGYSANAVARALRTQRTGTIGVVVPAISNPYFIGVVEALESELAACAHRGGTARARGAVRPLRRRDRQRPRRQRRGGGDAAGRRAPARPGLRAVRLRRRGADGEHGRRAAAGLPLADGAVAPP